MGKKCALSLTKSYDFLHNWTKVINRTRSVTLRAHFPTLSVQFEQRACRRYFYGRSCHKYTKPLSSNWSGQVTNCMNRQHWLLLVWKHVNNILFLLNYSLTYLLTHSMEQSPSWEANRFTASQESPRIHKCPPPVTILSHLDPVHTPTSHFLKINLNVILPYRPRSPHWSLSLRFPHQNPVYDSPPYAPHAQPISFFSLLSSAQYSMRSTDH